MTQFSALDDTVGDDLYDLAAQLFPICRSISGNGVRETLAILQDTIPVEIHEVATGTAVFDWVVPHEWNIRDAYIMNADGTRVVDFKRSNLHVVNGSQPIRQVLPWRDLKQRLYTLPEQPDVIPYRTCFFKEDWGFCLSQNTYDALEAAGDQSYEVVIDASITDGALTYGEFYLPGWQKDEVLISAHICHPSLANDNLSGICIAAYLADRLARLPDRRFSYRFVFAPATIGAITWLAQNQEKLDQIKHGLVLALLGDAGHSTYKRTRSGDTEIDRIVEHILTTSGAEFELRDFVPYGYDERQYGSPGINLAMGCLMRTPNGEFPQYHTSADNLDFIKPEFLQDSLEKCLRIVEIIEKNQKFINRFPFCEPRLGKHGLYQSLPEDADKLRFQEAVQWVLNFSDGDHTLLDIAMRSGMEFQTLHNAALRLAQHDLIEDYEPSNQSDKAIASAP